MLDGLYRPIGRLLRWAQATAPDEIVETVMMSVAEIGGSDAVLYVLDYQQTHLTPHPDVLPHGQRPVLASVEGSMAGRAMTSGHPLAARRDGGWQAWIPLTDRTDRLGVLALSLSEWNDDVEQVCVEIGIATAHLLVSGLRYSDQIHRLRRRQEMSLAAEMQWSLLPPLALTCAGTTITGLLEPAYEVGGDCFDYAWNNRLLDLAIFDAMGHGLGSAVVASLTMGAYRNFRRQGPPPGLVADLSGESQAARLGELTSAVDSALASIHHGRSFVTAAIGQLDADTGRLHWISAGHAPPMHVRRGTVLTGPDVEPDLPLGLDLGPIQQWQVHTTQLEPGDCLLFYTDGVTTAGAGQRAPFGEDRLRDLLARETAGDAAPTEVLRRLLKAVVQAQADEDRRLRDDASLMYLQWSGPEPRLV
jgi:serine phosphatase RsbU (regulator of sigma subunit)